ncbi:ATP-binding cassette domain-containing protein [Caldicellulosiruptoraceae bacterium PP1]
MGIVISENLTKKFKDKFAVNNLSFILEEGKIYGILGKNGAGKSTLLKLLVGLYFPNSGSIKVFGKQPEAGDKRIGYLSENLAAYFNLSAYDNVGIVSKMSGIKMNKNQIYNILEEVNLENFAHKKVSDFSLGMKSVYN